MREFAVRYSAVGSVPAHRHRGMLERTVLVCAVREELALFIGLMGFDLSRTGMPSNTFGIFACCTKRASVGHVYRSAFWSSRRLMDVRTRFVGATEVEVAHRGERILVRWLRGLLDLHGRRWRAVHLRISIHCRILGRTRFCTSLPPASILESSSTTSSTSAWSGFNALEQRSTLLIRLLGIRLLEGRIKRRLHHTGHELCHHSSLLFHHCHEFHLLCRRNWHHRLSRLSTILHHRTR